MDSELVNQVISEIKRLWRVTNDLEVTLEANPTSSEAAKFKSFSDAGVNRLSMGIQALNNQDLKRLGRLHSAEEAQTAFDLARNAFGRVSFDLIYARQDQTLKAWEAELTIALSMSVDHLSLYQLTIEPGTAFGSRFQAGGLLGLPSEDLGADMYQTTQDITSSHGMAAYEISNHAQKNSESQHNLIYWRGGDYLGVGPGAHGRMTLEGGRYETHTELEPISWLRTVEISGSGEQSRTLISQSEQLVEYLLMGLRLCEGLDTKPIQSFANFEKLLNKINVLSEFGYVVFENDRLKISSQYKMVLNSVLSELLNFD